MYSAETVAPSMNAMYCGISPSAHPPVKEKDEDQGDPGPAVREGDVREHYEAHTSARYLCFEERSFSHSSLCASLQPVFC
jgi:hypothetical protein